MEVGVSVGVNVGVFVFVGDGVMVGVGVSVANKFDTGLLGVLTSQKISRPRPPSTSTPAAMYIIFGLFRCRRFRYALITSEEEEGVTGGLLFIDSVLFTQRVKHFDIPRNVK